MSSKYKTHFGNTLLDALRARDLTQSALASKMDKKVSYVNRTMVGKRPATSNWADLVANAIEASDEERQRLHHAAALDQGFKLDLTKK